MAYVNKNSVEIWRGPSRIYGRRIVVIVSGYTTKPKDANDKTGNMIQTYILVQDSDPIRAVAEGLDVSICGGCVHRKNKKTGKRSCYVNLGQGPLSVWRAWMRGNIRAVSPMLASEMATGRAVRLGTYGDPAAVPAHVWRELLTYASKWTGYTHQAASPKFQDVLEWCQVSADLVDDAIAARRAGVGSFRVLVPGEEPQPWEEMCPSLQGVKCEDCGACSGFTGRHIVNPVHGIGARNFDPNRIRRRALSLPVLNPARAMA